MPKIVSLDPALVAAAGITPNAASNLEDIERALQEAPALRKRLGITSLDRLKRIGEGSWARVYRLGDGRVLKLTTDASDANAAALVAGAPSRPAGLAPVHEVVKFPWPVRDRKWDPIRGRSGDVKRDLYAIVMTYVPKAKEDSPEEELLDQIFRAFDNLLVDTGFNGTNPLWELRRREEDDLTPWLWDLTHGWMWLAERGWVVRDVSTHNIGILNGEVVLLDMGLSSTEGALAPEIDMAANPGTSEPMAPVIVIFDECFATLKQQFPDFGEIELHEDEKAGGDNGHGSERQFGYCKDGDPIVLAFAAKTGSLARPFIRGLMRHEFGHAIDFRYGKGALERTLGIKLPAGVERRADAIAEAVFGDPIVYGGKHLVQCVSCKGEYPRPKKLGA